MPLFGMAIGAATARAAGAALTDVGVDDKFMKELGEKLQPGGAAVFVLVRQSTPTRSCPRSRSRARSSRRRSTTRAEEQLQEALANAGRE